MNDRASRGTKAHKQTRHTYIRGHSDRSKEVIDVLPFRALGALAMVPERRLLPSSPYSCLVVCSLRPLTSSEQLLCRKQLQHLVLRSPHHTPSSRLFLAAASRLICTSALIFRHLSMINSFPTESLSRRSSHRSGSDESQSSSSYSFESSANMPLDWSQQEDDQLRHCISLPHSSWSELAQIAFPEGARNSEDCMERWSVISKPRSIRGPWTAGEDALLTQLTGEMGPKDWTAIAKRLRSRSGKQCRERWHNHLDPTSQSPFVLLSQRHL